jgi:hypothetical protein
VCVLTRDRESIRIIDVLYTGSKCDVFRMSYFQYIGDFCEKAIYFIISFPRWCWSSLKLGSHRTTTLKFDNFANNLLGSQLYIETNKENMRPIVKTCDSMLLPINILDIENAKKW